MHRPGSALFQGAAIVFLAYLYDVPIPAAAIWCSNACHISRITDLLLPVPSSGVITMAPALDAVGGARRGTCIGAWHRPDTRHDALSCQPARPGFYSRTREPLGRMALTWIVRKTAKRRLEDTGEKCSDTDLLIRYQFIQWPAVVNHHILGGQFPCTYQAALGVCQFTGQVLGSWLKRSAVDDRFFSF